MERWLRRLGALLFIAWAVGYVATRGDPGGWLRENWRGTYWVPGESMAPTLLSGDMVMVDKGAYTRRDPARGEIAVYRLATDLESSRRFPTEMAPDLPVRAYVARVVGLPGDEVEIERGVLFIDGEAVAETAAR